MAPYVRNDKDVWSTLGNVFNVCNQADNYSMSSRGDEKKCAYSAVYGINYSG